MALEPPTNTDLPWMVSCKPLVDINFKVKMSSLNKEKDGGPDGKWSCYRGDMKDIDGFDDEKACEIPFWAMEPFFDAYTEAAEDNPKGWQEFTYCKTTGKDEKSYATFEVVE